MSYSVQNIRNVALIGHGGSGKTALAESLLYMTKAIDRMGKATDGNTVCDYDPEEVKRQISISLAVAPGERVHLKAPSGFGKTTLARVLAGYERPRAGTVLVNGEPLPRRGPCPVQLIGQHPELTLAPRLRMERSLAEAGAAPDTPEGARLMDALGIRSAWLARFPHELSGGELQRFCIARALGERTKFLLADEITAMLDLITQSQIWDFLLKETSDRGIGLLVVSHSEELLKRLATRRVEWE